MDPTLTQLMHSDHNIGGGNITKFPYHAINDGSIDCTSIIQQAIDESPLNPDATGRVVIPPGVFRCDDDIHITRPVIIEGHATAGNNSSVLQFAEGKGIICHNNSSNPLGPSVDMKFGSIRAISVRCTPRAIPDLQPSTAYAIGDRVRIPASLTTLRDNRFAYHLYCKRAGTSGSSLPLPSVIADVPGPEAKPWTPSTPFRVGNHVVSVAANGFVYRAAPPNATAGTLTPAGTTGTIEPTWPILRGTTVVDGTVTWFCVGPENSIGGTTTFIDGTVTWVCTVHAGIFAMSSVKISDVYINRKSVGIHIQAQGSYPTWPCDANEFSVERCWIQGTDGHGMYVRGDDSNGGVVTNVRVDTVPGRGFYDGSLIGNTYVGCQTDACGISPRKSTSPSCTWLGGYDESALNNNEWAGPTFGGATQPDTTSSGPHFGNVSARLTVKSTLTSPQVWISGVPNDASVFTWNGPSEYSGYYHSLTYNIVQRGWVSFAYNLGGSLSFSGSGADEGSGLMWIRSGEFRGDNNIYDGNKWYIHYSSQNLVSNFVRGGRVITGDRIEIPAKRGEYAGKIATTAGYVGATWGANKHVEQRYWPHLDANYVHVQATAIVPLVLNGFVYHYTKTGTSGATEPTYPTIVGPEAVTFVNGDYRPPGTFVRPTTPNDHIYTSSGGILAAEPTTWPTTPGGTVVSGTVTLTEAGSDVGTYVADGTALLTCVGKDPQWSRYGRIAEESQAVTSDGSDAVIDSYPLPDADTTRILVRVTAFQGSGSGSPSGAMFETEGAWSRSSSTIVEIMSPVTNSHGNPAWGAILVVNGTHVDLVVHGEASKSVIWKSLRME